jgi:phosphoglucomutase
MGVLLTDYILLCREELGKMPKNPAVIRSIVTSAMVDRLCEKRGVYLAECLTGFKWIASVTEDFLRTGDHSYVFGYEESYGYTVEAEIRDKDGVSAAALCAEMTLYWRSKGKSLLDRLNELFCEFGYFEDVAISQNFPGNSGTIEMANIMEKLRRDGLKTLAGKKVEKIRDVQESVVFSPENMNEKTEISLPKSNVLQFYLEDGTIVSARPSGTEPKIKFYINCPVQVENGDLAKAKAAAKDFCDKISKEISSVLSASK